MEDGLSSGPSSTYDTHLSPALRLDGYYVVSDLIGVPDLFAYMKPILRSLVPGRRAGAAVTQAQTDGAGCGDGGVLLTVAVLVAVVVRAPRLVVTAWDSMGLHATALAAAVDEASVASATVSAVQLVVLLLPLAAMTVGPPCPVHARPTSACEAAANGGFDCA